MVAGCGCGRLSPGDVSAGALAVAAAWGFDRPREAFSEAAKTGFQPGVRYARHVQVRPTGHGVVFPPFQAGEVLRGSSEEVFPIAARPSRCGRV